MSSTGFGNYDQLTPVDSADVEQLQLNFDASNFDGSFHTAPNGHHMVSTSTMRGNLSSGGGMLPRISDMKLKFATVEQTLQKQQQQQQFQSHATHKTSSMDGFGNWSSGGVASQKVKLEDGIKLPSNYDYQRTSPVWSKCATNHTTYSLVDGYLENLRYVLGRKGGVLWGECGCGFVLINGVLFLQGGRDYSDNDRRE